MDGSELTGQKIAVYTNGSKYDTKATDSEAIFLAPDAHKAITGSESTVQKIPVHTSDDKCDKYDTDADTVSEYKEITALREEIAYLKQAQDTQETIYQGQVISLQASLAAAMSKIEVSERQYIAPLQMVVTSLDNEHHELRWEHKRRLAEIQASQDAVTEDKDSSSVEGGALGPINKNDEGVQLKGLAVLLGALFVLVAVFAASLGGSGQMNALGDWIAAIGKAFGQMAEVVVDGSWGTAGCQAMDGR
jgi:hypothetical protein